VLLIKVLSTQTSHNKCSFSHRSEYRTSALKQRAPAPSSSGSSFCTDLYRSCPFVFYTERCADLSALKRIHSTKSKLVNGVTNRRFNTAKTQFPSQLIHYPVYT